MKVLKLILKQGRMVETMYGVYCFCTTKPSPVAEDLDEDRLARFEAQAKRFRRLKNDFVPSDSLKRDQGVPYAVHLLPDGLRARRHSVVEQRGFLFYGEYGLNSGRIFMIGRDGCQVFDHYNHVPGVRHIHSIQPYRADKLLVSTGDSAKLLDQWSIEDGALWFDKTLMRRFAGFTTSVKVGEDYYFGTDFSERPNYIYRLRDGKKFYFPRPTYRQFAELFEVYEDRYILTLNANLQVFGGQSFTVFDTQTERFLYVCRHNV